MDVIETGVPKVLFIKGVFVRDCILDDIFEEQIMDRANDEKPEISSVIRLPDIFSGMKMWIKKTNIPCFYCDKKFDTIPIFVPKSAEMIGDKLVMVPEGCFHSFNCAICYIDLYYPRIDDNIDRKNMLKMLYYIFTGKKIDHIKRAKNKYKMIHWGGHLTPAEWEKCIPKITIVA